MAMQEEIVMNEFAQFVLSKLQGSVMLILLAVPLLAVSILTAYFICKKKRKVFPWRKVITWTLLSGYLLALIYVTLLRAMPMGHSVNLHLFRAWREAWNSFSVRNWLNVLLNVAMFIPLGFLLPLVFPKLKKWYTTFGIGFGLSVAIELLQLWRCTGVCDVDDLFANTLGTVFGYSLITFIGSFTVKGKTNWKQKLCWGLVLLLTAGGITGIFVGYELREYGNIPNMASFRVNTSAVHWKLTCSLPEEQKTMQTYRTKTMTKEDCASLAAKFFETFGIVFDDVQYYDDEAYFMDHGGDDGSHFLIISYRDGGYDYRGNTHAVDTWADADRETVMAALEEYPLSIPAEAVFSVDGDGWHSFTANRLVDGNFVYDGILRCRYGADGLIYEVEDHLIQYKPYEKVEIISQDAAFDRLCLGNFSGGDYFEYSDPKDIQVVRAALEYRIDTKGFYRPVYVFDLMATDCAYQANVMVRAD